LLDEFVRPDAESRLHPFTQLHNWALTYQDMANSDSVIFTVYNRYLLASVSLPAVIDGLETVRIDETENINICITYKLARAIMEYLETKKRMKVVDKMVESSATLMEVFMSDEFE
jgi:hypothetical protein